MAPNDFLKYVKDQYDRLQEISPLIPPEIIHEFQLKFANEKDISKPEEANGLEKITVYRNDVDLNVSDPNDARSPHIKLRTPKLANAATALVSALQQSKKPLPVAETKLNPLFKATLFAKKEKETEETPPITIVVPPEDTTTPSS
jgi:hypothetical protein